MVSRVVPLAQLIAGFAISALTIIIPLYSRFVATENEISKLVKAVDESTRTIRELNAEVAKLKTTNALLEYRLSTIENGKYRITNYDIGALNGAQNYPDYP